MLIRSLLFISYFAVLPLLSAPLKIQVEAESAILINADTLAILYQKNPREKHFPASITKIATAAFALKLLQGKDLSYLVEAEQDCIGSVSEEAKQRSGYTLPSYWLVKDCCHVGIKRGEKLSMHDLMMGMLVASADDASNIIAYSLSKGNIPAFMEGMNKWLKEIGCKDTHFNNPHGLHHPEHVTTAYDMAIIAKEALKDPFFREAVLSTRFKRPKTNKQEPTILVQTNRLLRAGEFYYPKAIGIKTGWMSKSGHTFVAAAKDGDRTLIAVLLKEKKRNDIFKESIRLFEAAFNEPKVEKLIVRKGPQKYSLEIEGAKGLLETEAEEEYILSYYPSEEPKIRAFLQWDKLDLPIKKGEKVGEVEIKTSDLRLLKKVPLVAKEDVEPSFLFSIRSLFFGKGAFGYIIFGGVLLLLAFVAFRLTRRA